MTDDDRQQVIARLRVTEQANAAARPDPATQAARAAEDYTHGRELGRRRAAEEATYDELARLSDQVAFHDNDPARYVARAQVALGVLAPEVDLAGGVIRKISRRIDDDCKAAEFWARQTLMPAAAARPLLTGPHFVAGFVAGALEVWEAVKDELGDDRAQ